MCAVEWEGGASGKRHWALGVARGMAGCSAGLRGEVPGSWAWVSWFWTRTEDKSPKVRKDVAPTKERTSPDIMETCTRLRGATQARSACGGRSL